MILEEEIKQKAFRNEGEKALVNIQYTGNFLLDQSSAVLKDFNINEQHYNILRILKGRFPGVAGPGEIKEVLLNKRGDLTRLLDKLVKKNWVDRCSNEENRRRVDIRITEMGLEQLEKMTANLDHLKSYASNLTEEELKTLNLLLDKLRG